MPNITTVLREEIARLARKELRGETESLKKASARYRSEIAALKRRLDALEKSATRIGKTVAKRAGAVAAPAAAEDHSGLRFSAKGLRTLRQRLGLSGADMAALLDVSLQSLYNWEAGKTRPRASHLPAIAALRHAGKREISARLAALGKKTA